LAGFSESWLTRSRQKAGCIPCSRGKADKERHEFFAGGYGQTGESLTEETSLSLSETCSTAAGPATPCPAAEYASVLKKKLKPSWYEYRRYVILKVLPVKLR